MYEGDGEDAATKADLQTANPNWNVWRSRRKNGDDGDWCATRHRNLTRDEMSYGLARTLIQDTARELSDALEAQRTLERVWRREQAARRPVGL